MRATAQNGIEVGRPVSASATPDLAAPSSRNIASNRRAANADDYRPKHGQVVEAAAARIGPAIAGAAQRVRDGLERRRTVRELRLLGRSRLADIGIEPDDVERVIDEMIATRRRRATAEERRPQSKSE